MLNMVFLWCKYNDKKLRNRYALPTNLMRELFWEIDQGVAQIGSDRS